MQPPVPPSKRGERREAPTPTTVREPPAQPWRSPGAGTIGPGQAPGAKRKHTFRNVALGCLVLLFLPAILSALFRQAISNPNNASSQNTAQTRPAGATDQAVIGLAVAAVKTCAQAPILNPVNCPQAVNGPGDAIGVTWTMYGEPAAGAHVIYQDGQFYAYGHTVMTVSYSRGSQQSLQVVRVPFQATVQWQGNQGRVTALKSGDNPSGPVVVPRPAALSDQGALDVTKTQFEQCAQTTSEAWPPVCFVPLPQLFVQRTTTFHWRLGSDPRLNARPAYDAEYGVVHIIGSYTLVVTYTDSSGSHTRQGGGNYDGTVGVNGSGRISVLLIKGA
jgi:hypothetical protein